MVDGCEHPEFAASVAVQRLANEDGGPIRNFIAEVAISCSRCKMPFHFVGLDAGLSFTRPTVSIGATTLNVPIAPGEAPLQKSITYSLAGAMSGSHAS